MSAATIEAPNAALCVIMKRKAASPDGENPLHKIAETPAQQDGNHKRAQWHLEDSLCQHEYLEGKGRRQNRGYEDAEKRVPFHPVLDFPCASARMAMEVCFSALLCEQVEPNAPCERADGRHRNVVGHARRIRVGELKDERIGDKRKRQNGGIEESYNEKAASAHDGDKSLKPRG